jgi:hypothetical protein
MQMIVKRLVLIWLLFGLHHCFYGTPAYGQRGKADVNYGARPAAVLSNEFETLFFAKADILVRSGARDHAARNDVEILDFPFWELLDALKALGGNTSQEALGASEAVFVGAKDFRAPAGLGTVHSQRCYIMILRSPSKFSLREHFHQAPSASVGGSPVWEWSAKLGEFGEEDPTRASLFFAAQVGDSYLLVSNGFKELQVTAQNLASPKDPAMVVPIGDWKLISQHNLWGYRRYRHGGIVDPEAAGSHLVPESASALIFFVDLDKQVGALRLLSSPKDEKIVAKLSEPMKLPTFENRGSGVWESRIPLGANEESFYRLGAIMDLFGFGTYV